MPSNWAMIDNSFPSWTGTESPRVMIVELQNYLMILVEQLKYQLNNLDSKNWNDAALKELKSLTTEGVETELSNMLKDLTAGLETLSTMAGRLQQAETTIAYLEQSQWTLDNTVADLQVQVNGLDGDIANLFAVVKPDGDGGVQIGQAEKEIRIIGKVYINGVLLEGGSA